MSNMQFDIVLPSQVKLRNQLKDGDQRFNKETKMFEYWDSQSQSWVPTSGSGSGGVSGDYVTRAEFNHHKEDPAGHILASSENAGFIDPLSFTKVREVETNLSPDPTTILDNILGK